MLREEEQSVMGCHVSQKTYKRCVEAAVLSARKKESLACHECVVCHCAVVHEHVLHARRGAVAFEDSGPSFGSDETSRLALQLPVVQRLASD